MTYYKMICLMLLVVIICHVSANYERVKTLAHFNDISKIPWRNEHDIYNTAYAASELLPHYYNSYGLIKNQSKNHSIRPERFLVTSIKKKSSENKHLKKPTSLFHIFTNNNFTKHKEAVLKPPGIAYCREIEMKGKESEPQKSVKTCYKCKDFKSKFTYERCLYNNHPEESVFHNAKVKRSPSTSADFKHRRSNSENNRNDYGKSWYPYRFTDEYFSDATHDLPAAYESKEEKCDKIIKNSMVCMVCKNAKTNGKYEQCSYVKQPHEKAYSYTKSSSPEKSQMSDTKHLGRNSYPKISDFESSNGHKDRNKNYLKQTLTANEEQIEPQHTSQEKIQNKSSADCKQIQIDSKTCTICKDSKTGGTYEKCSYDYEPSDRIYKYHRSKSFGYPDKILSSIQDSDKTSQTSDKSKNLHYVPRSDFMHKNIYSDKSDSLASTRDFGGIPIEAEVANNPDKTSQTASDDNDYFKTEKSSNYQVPLSSDSNPESHESLDIPSSELASSISEHSFDNINIDNCKKFQKDSMTCTICKDAKTGNDFEQCSYSYRPSDKVFSYSKSSSFGNSRKNDKPHHEDEESSSSEILERAYEHVPGQTYKALKMNEGKFEDDFVKGSKRTDIGYLPIKEKAKETQVSLQNFRMEDQSKCKKIMRADQMTCYQCVDEDNFQKEECFFIAPQDPEKNQFVFHEVKKFQINPALHSDEIKSPNSMKIVSLEPNASASGNSYAKLEKPDNHYPDEVIHDDTMTEEIKEAEPYDYTSETRSRYDTILGLTLPAYMLTTSEHEAIFDEVVASSYDER